jgi:hypothetical protein
MVETPSQNPVQRSTIETYFDTQMNLPVCFPAPAAVIYSFKIFRWPHTKLGGSCGMLLNCSNLALLIRVYAHQVKKGAAMRMRRKIAMAKMRSCNKAREIPEGKKSILKHPTGPFNFGDAA